MNADQWHKLGLHHAETGQLNQAIEALQHAIVESPNEPVYHNNLANVYKSGGLNHYALRHYQRAIDLDPNFAEAHHNRSHIMLQRAQLPEAWHEYEWRWKIPGNTPPTKPLDMTKRAHTLQLLTDQGAGDTFQFIRYAALLKPYAKVIALKCKPEMVPILKSCPYIDTFEEVESDAQVYLTSLPAHFNSTLDSIPRQVPYIYADPERVKYWKSVFAKFPANKTKIGIAWQGNPNYKHDKTRSIPVREFKPLALPHVQLISLQQWNGLDQVQDAAIPLVAFTNVDKKGAFTDTAAIIANLNLVITSDTSIAHLAGAMGKQVWIAINHNPEWRWFLRRSRSPWYPTMRLYRQHKPGDWTELFYRMSGDLVVPPFLGAIQEALLDEDIGAFYDIAFERLEIRVNEAAMQVSKSANYFSLHKFVGNIALDYGRFDFNDPTSIPRMIDQIKEVSAKLIEAKEVLSNLQGDQ